MSTARTEGNDYTKANKENGNNFFKKNLANSKKNKQTKTNPAILRFSVKRWRSPRDRNKGTVDEKF